MSNTETISDVNSIDLIQADEGSGRPSAAVPTPASDRLTQQAMEVTPLPADDYNQLILPEALQGCDEMWTSFKKLAAELKLPAETAQKLVEWEATAAQNGRKTSAQERADILDKWTQQTKELFGASYQQNIAQALQAAERFGGPELRELLDLTGLGSHPVVVKTFRRIYQQISEDLSVSGKLRNQADKTFAEALYGRSSS